MNPMPVCQWKWVLEKNSLFQRITSFRSIFQIYVVWVPISAVEGPHWVPISLKIRSPLGPHEKYFGSPLNVGAVKQGARRRNMLRGNKYQIAILT